MNEALVANAADAAAASVWPGPTFVALLVGSSGGTELVSDNEDP